VELARRLIRGENLEYTDPDLREITVPVKLITAADLE
jgi:hypothetical protein